MRQPTYSTLALLNRWHLMLTTLAGGPLPELPDVPGRVHRMPPPDGRDVYPEQHRRELQAAAVWRALAGEVEGGDGSADPD